jgi:hypothetical protein
MSERRTITVAVKIGAGERQYRQDAAGVLFRRRYRPLNGSQPWTVWERVSAPSAIDNAASALLLAAYLADEAR